MPQRKVLLGLGGVVGIWITAGLALPLINILRIFSPEQLMTFRGGITVLLVVAIGGRTILKKVDTPTYLLALVLPLATLGLYKAIRYWGAGPTIIIITATPIVNLVIGMSTGRKMIPATLFGIILVCGGILIARWDSVFQWKGFLWAVFGAVMNALVYELFAHSRSKPLQKCFWSMLGTFLLGFSLSTTTSWGFAAKPELVLALICFGLIGGFLYWYSNLLAFENLPTTEASLLAQGETPAVLIGAYLLLGEHLMNYQWIGILISIVGTMYISYRLSKEKA